MDGTISAWLPGSFYRTPAWRFARAGWLFERGKRINRRFDDEWVARTRRFLAAQGRNPSGPDRRRSARLDPPLQGALDLSREEHPHRRWQVEAFLLTPEPLEEVARRCDLPVETLEAYHEVLFHVRPHLGAGDWIMARVVGTSWWRGFGDLPLGALWKYAAHTAGPRALEAMIAVTTGQPFPEWVRDSMSTDPACEEARLRLLGKLAVAALKTNSPAEWESLLEAREQLRGLDPEALATPDEPNGLLPAMEGFLKSLSGGKLPGRNKAAGPPKSEEGAQEHGGEGEAGWRATAESLLETLT